MHLLMHAKTFGTLTNTQVGIKEMVHRIFKGMVPKTNCKNINLDLLKRVTVRFPECHFPEWTFSRSRFSECRFPELDNFPNSQYPESQYPEFRFPESQFP